MRRIALFSDVHGNLPALDAVLRDIDTAGLAQVYCLGDLVGYGPYPAEVIGRIRERRVPTIRGNYDDGIGKRRGDCGCYYATEQARADGDASYAFTDAALSEAARAWLVALPGEMRFDVDGVRVLLTHGSPRSINEYLLPDRTDEQLTRLADAAEADVVCVGHVHVPYHRVVRGADGRPVHYVSSGSVGKPKDCDPRAGWVELLLGEDASVRAAAWDNPAAGPAGRDVGYGAPSVATKSHRVEYDVEAAVAGMLAAGLPETLTEALRRG